MIDDNTPEVTVEASNDAAPTHTEAEGDVADGALVDVTGTAPALAPAKARRGTGRSAPSRHTSRPMSSGDNGESADASVTGSAQDTAAGVAPDRPADDEEHVVRESSMSTSDFEAITGDLQETELFDPEEVAGAPRAPHPLKPVVEALIFASPEPLTIKAIGRLLDDQPREDIETALAEVRDAYVRSDGLQLVEVAGGFQIVTRPELYEWVRRLFKERTTSKLSVQALETLAVIAYKQPVTSGEIAEIRGVSATTGVLNTLLDRKLVKIVGRKQVVGRPFMYGTTREFLDKFGLKDLSDLPKVEDMSEALGFDLPSRVDGGDGGSLPFDDSAPVELLPFQAEDLQSSAPQAEAAIHVAEPASTDSHEGDDRDTEPPVVPDAPEQEH